MRILLLSAYDAHSHRYWHQGLIKHCDDHDFTLMTLPPRYFSWRIRGNSMSWAFGKDRALLSQSYDLVIATSMTDLASLRGFLPELASTPTLLYFHENQFAYPETNNVHASVEPMMVTLYAALAADHLAFNTDYNRHTFLTGVDRLLHKLPDHVPVNLVEQLRQKSSVIPVPLPAHCFTSHREHNNQGALRMVWNHRWEYDKGPDLLLAILNTLESMRVDYIIDIVGQQFRQQPSAFKVIKDKFAHRIARYGYLTHADAYRQCLSQADVVLSTADHDFQGIAVLEGVAAGAIPVVPNRLAYPELLDTTYCYTGTTQKEETKAAAIRIAELAQLKQSKQLPTTPDISHLSWDQIQHKYCSLIADLTAIKKHLHQ